MFSVNFPTPSESIYSFRLFTFGRLLGPGTGLGVWGFSWTRAFWGQRSTHRGTLWTLEGRSFWSLTQSSTWCLAVGRKVLLTPGRGKCKITFVNFSWRNMRRKAKQRAGMVYVIASVWFVCLLFLSVCKDTQGLCPRGAAHPYRGLRLSLFASRISWWLT